MYTEEDLDSAVESGIFSKDSVEKFRQHVASSKHTIQVDEENFRLVSGFNDVFVVIACVLLLSSTFAVFPSGHKQAGLVLFNLMAWGLAEFFVRQRKMALPAIVLLLAFVGGIFALGMSFTDHPIGKQDTLTVLAAALAAALAAFLHWKRFHVPITVAAGTGAFVVFILSLVVSVSPGARDWMLVLVFCCGIASFLFAMFWDMSDRLRVTHKSDVAFWLHLLSAPLIIHPIFSTLGILDGRGTVNGMLLVLGFYFLMTFISLTIDRRAFMVSSLIYVIYALSELLKIFGNVTQSFAITGVIIGSALLLLSAFWHSSREKALNALPQSIYKYVPPIKSA